jgi:hypothetical protein
MKYSSEVKKKVPFSVPSLGNSSQKPEVGKPKLIAKPNFMSK